MKKLFLPYYGFIVVIGLLIALNALVFQGRLIEINEVFALLMVMVSMSEGVYYFFTHHMTVTLSCSIVIFGAAMLPFSSVVILILTLTVLGRVGGYIRKDYKTIVDTKWLFNVATYVILAKLAAMAFYIVDYKFLNGIDQFIVLATVCVMHNLINVLITYTVISLNMGTNAFKDFDVSGFLTFSFYNIMFASLLWFGYLSYGALGLAFLAILIVPLQRSIVMQSRSEEITQQLTEDSLTKAKNRRCFEDMIYERLDKQMPFSLLFLDLDRFKSINDTYGHVVGDEILVDLVSKVKGFLRHGDYIFRYGGDEFCILTYDNEYGPILFEMLKKNGEHFSMQTPEGSIEYDFTMSMIQYDGLTRDNYRNVMQKADRAMYQRKQVV